MSQAMPNHGLNDKTVEFEKNLDLGYFGSIIYLHQSLKAIRIRVFKRVSLMISYLIFVNPLPGQNLLTDHKKQLLMFPKETVDSNY